MNRQRLQAAPLAGLLLCLLLVGCARCNSDARPNAIASLTKLVGGGVTRDYADRLREWVKAEPNAQLALGDGARTDGDSSAELSFTSGASLSLRPNTTVRLLADDEHNQTGLDIQAGEAVLHTGSQGLSLRTHVGMAMIAPDSEIVLHREGDTLGFAVSLGQLNFRDRDAEETQLNAGDSMNVGIGMAVLSLQRAQGPGEEADAPISIEVVSGQVRAGNGSGRPLGTGTHQVSAGTHLRLPEGSEVVVKRGQERVHLRGAGDFTVGLESAIAESKRGVMHLEAVEVDVEVRVPGGVIIARKGGSAADVTVGSEGGSLRVLRGTVSAQVAGRDAAELHDGQSYDWRNDAQAATGGASSGPDYRHMGVRAGASFVVHTPSAPVAIGFDFSGKCPGEGQVEQLGTRQISRGTGSANLSFNAGTRGYTVRCVGVNGPGGVVARGSVQVLVDPGTRKLPARAPTSTVEADGRTYSIYYQNQLPEVIARWPNAPAQKRYRLQVDQKTIELSEPEHRFKSGSLGDGSHSLVFEAQGRRSRTTTVEVHFDNVAPKAALSGPADRAFEAGDVVTVEGVALPTWKVALEGGTIAMSSGDRFSGQVQTTAERPDVAVRLSHPRLGTHYYLRRASGSP